MGKRHDTGPVIIRMTNDRMPQHTASRNQGNAVGNDDKWHSAFLRMA